jgi:hypothetical protein
VPTWVGCHVWLEDEGLSEDEVEEDGIRELEEAGSDCDDVNVDMGPCDWDEGESVTVTNIVRG